MEFEKKTEYPRLFPPPPKSQILKTAFDVLQKCDTTYMRKCVFCLILIANFWFFGNGYFMNPAWCKAHEIKSKKGTLLLLYIQPGASKSAIKGIHGDRLKISIQAPPIDGAANEAIIAFLAKTLQVAKSQIHQLTGQTSRQKNFWVEGVEIERVMKYLSCYLRLHPTPS